MKRASGPVILVAGLIILALAALPNSTGTSTTAWWIVTSALTVERIVPLIALAAALVLVTWRQALLAVLLFLAGTLLSYAYKDTLVSQLTTIPHAAEHLFFVGPLSCAAAGLVLIAPRSMRLWLLWPGAVIVGMMSGLATKLTDPSLNDPGIIESGLVVNLWVIAAIGLTGSAFYYRWYPIAGPILGSWILAIGVLYGGASFVGHSNLPPLATSASPSNTAFPKKNEFLYIPDPLKAGPSGRDSKRDP